MKKILLLSVLVLSACSSPPIRSKASYPVSKSLSHIQAEGAGREIVMYALGLLDVSYQFGGNNPEAGLDCSGMVSFIYKNAVGAVLPHNAAQIASLARPVASEQLRAGDLVFFNTLGRSFSHMGIYLGDGRFIHAPSSKGKIRVESLSSPYFAQRFEGGRSLLAQNP
ncbi:C40 family peptidase [Iodobacter ciconiae]|uniref:Peptidoglycan endopeptidase n=1 Tax=Iodobacter ciconiae TaxID=2496266 RepID=A0A3S8ZSV5_9NEIS|nr:C40 family peptidase [Iodobacter ciconiae]AZN36534.1 peptidoglycan endopeptidase [Iodobacter ciconiae]